MSLESQPSFETPESASHEEKENVPDKDILLYEDLKASVEGEHDEDANTLFNNIEKAAVHYAKTADANEHWWRKRLGEGLDAEEMEQADMLERRRTAAHEVLIDALNALSRRQREDGLDNSWRNVIGLERDKIGLWGRKVARHITDKLLEEQRLDASQRP